MNFDNTEIVPFVCGVCGKGCPEIQLQLVSPETVDDFKTLLSIDFRVALYDIAKQSADEQEFL